MNVSKSLLIRKVELHLCTTGHTFSSSSTLKLRVIQQSKFKSFCGKPIILEDKQNRIISANYINPNQVALNCLSWNLFSLNELVTCLPI